MAHPTRTGMIRFIKYHDYAIIIHQRIVLGTILETHLTISCGPKLLSGGTKALRQEAFVTSTQIVALDGLWRSVGTAHGERVGQAKTFGGTIVFKSKGRVRVGTRNGKVSHVTSLLPPCVFSIVLPHLTPLSALSSFVFLVRVECRAW